MIAALRVVRPSTLVRYAALTALAALYAMPFLWMVSLSLKPFTELNDIPPRLIPSELTWSNYPAALFQPMLFFPQFFVNTLYISTILRPKVAAERSKVLNFYWMLVGLITGVYTFGLVGILLGPMLIGLLNPFDVAADGVAVFS